MYYGVVLFISLRLLDLKLEQSTNFVFMVGNDFSLEASKVILLLRVRHSFELCSDCQLCTSRLVTNRNLFAFITACTPALIYVVYKTYLQQFINVLREKCGV